MTTRPIKFRAWNKHQNQMSESPCIPAEIYEALRMPEQFSLLQFTGLLDKNGKEIYEGDILKSDLGSPGIMEWQERDACFTRFYPLNEFEVIGNIYENPELIK